MTEPTSSPLRQQPARVTPGPVPSSFEPDRPVARDVSDTQPIPVVAAVGATGAADPVLLVRAGLALLGAVASVVAAVLLYRHGLSEHVYPSYLAGTDHTDVLRYRGPWIGAAAAAVLVGGLLLLQAGKDLRRRVRR